MLVSRVVLYKLTGTYNKPMDMALLYAAGMNLISVLIVCGKKDGFMPFINGHGEEVCTSWFKAPYVCNGCSKVKKCMLTKTIYDALEAQRQAAEKISEIPSTEGEIARLNEILVKQGQSLHQIYLNH